MKPGTGWQIDPGILHAPGSLVTYEPQVNSDVFAMYQSLVEGRVVPWELLVKDVPPEHRQRSEYLLDMTDWPGNTDPEFAEHRHFDPAPASSVDAMKEGWLCGKLGRFTHASLFSERVDRFPAAAP